MLDICKAQHSGHEKWQRGRQKKPAPLVGLIFPVLALFWVVLAPTGCGQLPDAVIETPSQRITVSEEAARRLSERVSQALQNRGPLNLSLTEEELTSYLALNVQGLSLSHLAVWFAQGQVQFMARLNAWGRPEIRGKLDLTCSEGKAQVLLRQVTLNGRPLPRFFLASVEKAMNDALADAQLPVRVERIIVSKGLLLVTGTVD